MTDPPLVRWLARLWLASYLIGFVSAVIVLVGLLGQRVVGWLRDRGGW